MIFVFEIIEWEDICVFFQVVVFCQFVVGGLWFVVDDFGIGYVGFVSMVVDWMIVCIVSLVWCQGVWVIVEGIEILVQVVIICRVGIVVF